jgi:hypothetical protein
MAASGKTQSPVNYRHHKDGGLAGTGTAEQQNMLGPAFQERERFFLRSRGLKKYRCPHRSKAPQIRG